MSTQNRLNRREFIRLGSTGLIVSTLAPLLGGCTHKKFLNPDEEIVISGGRYTEYDKPHKALIIINLSQKEKRIIDCDFVPHGILIHPHDKYSLYCFQRDGHNACIIDLRKLEVTRRFHSDDAIQFSGYAAFSQDGKLIYTVESDTVSRQGSIAIRDAKSFDVTKRLPTLGLSPLECQLLDDNSIMVSNTGADESGFHKPSIVTIDLETEKLKSRLRLDDDSLDAGHFLRTDDGFLIVASSMTSRATDNQDKSSTGAISIIANDGPVVTIKEPVEVLRRMTGEISSIAYDSRRNILAVTQPDANLLSFWSIEKKEIVKAIGVERPHSVCLSLDKRHFIVSYGVKPAMISLETRELNPIPESFVQPTFTSGSHMINWSLMLREIMPKDIYG